MSNMNEMPKILEEFDRLQCGFVCEHENNENNLFLKIITIFYL